MGKKELETAASELGLAVDATFVPYSKSRYARSGGPDGGPWRSLNWTIVLRILGRGERLAEVLRTDYSCGTAFTPAEMDARGSNVTKEVDYQIEYGRKRISGKPIMPDPTDVIACIVADADALEYADFEQWASDTGANPDSRAAERTYNACVKVGLALRAAIGEAGLAKLRAAREGY